MNYVIISYVKCNVKRICIILFSPIIWILLLGGVLNDSLQLLANVIQFTGINIILSIISEINKQSQESKIPNLVNLYWSKKEIALYNLKCSFLTLAPIMVLIASPLLLLNLNYFLVVVISILTVLFIAIITNNIIEDELLKRLSITLPSVLILVGALGGARSNIFISLVILMISIMIFMRWLYVVTKRFEN